MHWFRACVRRRSQTGWLSRALLAVIAHELKLTLAQVPLVVECVSAPGRIDGLAQPLAEAPLQPAARAALPRAADAATFICTSGSTDRVDHSAKRPVFNRITALKDGWAK